MDKHFSDENELIEELEVLAAMKKVCIIRFETENGGRPEIRERITGVFTEDDISYLRTESGFIIRLNQLIQIDDILLKNREC